MSLIRSWCKLFALVPLLLLVGRARQPEKRNLDNKLLAGKVSITLEKGIWKLWEEQPVYQNMTLDLICNQGQCQSEVWGFAPSFNKDVDHQGTVEVSKLGDRFKLDVKLQIQSHPGNPNLTEAVYTIDLVPYRNQLIGSYRGEYNERNLAGKVTGKKNKLQFATVKEHQPLKAQEHPRLIFRAKELPILKAKAKTAHGREIVKELKKTLKEPIYYQGYVPTGGYHAAGHCFIGLLEDNPNAAQTGWKIVQKAIANPGKRFLEHSPIVAGVAIAYDLCYPLWSREQQQQVAQWLTEQTVKLVGGDTPKNGWNSYPWSNWNARARGAAGLAALAILNEPADYYVYNEFFQQPEDIEKLLKIAERNVMRYLDTALGDRGVGTEGDHYSTEPWRLAILPFLQGYREVKGIELAPSKTQWFLPQYVSRTAEIDGESTISSYGRHRLSPPASLYGIGLPLVPDEFVPGVLWFLEQPQNNYGVSNDLPISGIYALTGYPQQLQPVDPDKSWDKVLIDSQKGFYSFRNQWQGNTDIIASIYAKHEHLRASWSFPDAGSFRIVGLGHHWIVPGISKPQPENENIVVTGRNQEGAAKTTYFQSEKDGSGVVTIERDSWLRSFAVDYGGSGGVPGLFVVADRFKTENTEDFQPKVWNLHVRGKVEVKDNSFVVTSPDGTSLQGTFVSPEGIKISHLATETGSKIQVRAVNNFFVVFTLQSGKLPEVQVSGRDAKREVTVGNQRIRFDGSKIILAR